jgi:hypothetical protein
MFFALGARRCAVRPSAGFVDVAEIRLDAFLSRRRRRGWRGVRWRPCGAAAARRRRDTASADAAHLESIAAYATGWLLPAQPVIVGRRP